LPMLIGPGVMERGFGIYWLESLNWEQVLM
jgi:hypothetical protein